MKSWDQVCKEHDEMVAKFPVGATIIHTPTGNEWKVSGHTMAGLAISATDNPLKTRGYILPAEVKLSATNNREAE